MVLTKNGEIILGGKDCEVLSLFSSTLGSYPRVKEMRDLVEIREHDPWPQQYVSYKDQNKNQAEICAWLAFLTMKESGMAMQGPACPSMLG